MAATTSVRPLHAHAGTLAIATVLASCSAAAHDQRFPARDFLDKLDNAVVPQPIPTAARETPVHHVPTQPAAASYDIESVSNADPADAMALTMAAKSHGHWIATRGMACMARELAAAMDTLGEKLPSDELEAFLAQHCGVIVPSVQWSRTAWRVKDLHDEAQWRRDALASLGKHQEALHGPQPVAGRSRWIGQAIFKGSTLAVALTATVSPDIVLAPVPRVVAQGLPLVLTATDFDAQCTISASITVGPYDGAWCTSAVLDKRVQLSCPVSPDAPYATVDVVSVPAGRLLGSRVARLRLALPGKPPESLQVEPGAALPPAVKAAPQLVGLVNELRKASDRKPVALDAGQQAVLERAAPHFEKALSAGVPLADQILLAMWAGWRVAGAVEHGHSTILKVPANADMATVQRAVLTGPTSRMALLHPLIRTVAAVLMPDSAGNSTIAVFAWQTVAAADIAGDGKMVLARINAQRAQAKVKPVVHSRKLQKLVDAAAAAVTSAEPGPVQQALATMSEIGNGKFAGFFYAFGYEADAPFEVPAELLEAGVTRLVVAPCITRTAGSPWVQRTALVMYQHDQAEE